MNKIWKYLILIGLVACNADGNKAVDREKIKQEMKDRQIKRVSEPELMDAAFQTGASLASIAEDVLLEKLDDFYATIQSDATDSAELIIYRPLSQLIGPLLDSLSSNSGHVVSLFNLKLENLNPDTLEVEKQLLEAYQYNLENDVQSEDNVQRFGAEHLLFTRPITSKTGICLSTLLATNRAGESDSLKSQHVYFCGMWSIRLSKKEIIKSL